MAPVPASRCRGGGAVVHATLENAVPRERMYFGNYEAQPMTTMRQRIAEHMVASKHVSPHVYSIDEADMTRIAKIRANSKSAFETKYGTKLTFMPVLCARLRRGPARLSHGQCVGGREPRSCCTTTLTWASPWPWIGD